MNKLKITQIKSSIGCLKKHKSTLYGLGLRHIGHTVIRQNSPRLLGMINSISYLVKIKD
ncbi:rpmD [Wigglesworthia glossinidia endosymbiont of Glossina brevipalpis]|uniref:Large ribosomal subunit protein uL30 n=1 Tax=Wigglesworthia glossinidia brevipalpis TaxID=36870 RepID=RL30_WIGBR|nr:RecName: Full=Large ribosomal subunit protein uL30; AltName: Full=50S ribosomal protein L30 [Wigglesworthia glossinidia endosymbiont of Glossina brevipalpis]BAC24707.1 rpmD [Wigglesworthia glossinidia endosymbiont of Glossina brevipalpis]